MVKAHTLHIILLYIHVYSHFLDTEANDRVLLFLVDKGLQHTEGLRDGALKQLKRR